MGEYWRKFIENRHSSSKLSASTSGLFKEDPAILRENRLQELKLKIEYLPTSTPVFHMLSQICESDNASFMDFEEVFSCDPALVCNLLRLVNTSYFSLPRKIVSIKDALRNLDPNTIKTLLLAARNNSFSDKQFSVFGYLKDGFFKHSITTAVLAKIIALKLDYTEHESDSFYVSGLLHDLGKIVLLHYINDETPDFFQNQTEIHFDTLEPEKEFLIFNHVEVGGLICNKIRLSDEQKAEIKFHHAPLDAGINRINASILHCADYLAKTLKIGMSEKSTENLYIDEFALELLGMEKSSLLELAVNSIKTIELKHRIFDRMK